MSASLTLAAVPGIPEVSPGDDLAALIATALTDLANPLAPPADGDVIAVAQKVVSKAEGRSVELSAITPGERALELATVTEKDPRLVQAVLDESAGVVRAAPGVLIVRTRHGFVCANAGIDRSNVPGDETLLMLPDDADRSARVLRAGLQARLGVSVAVIVTDSFGRAWRVGQQDVAIGCAGLVPLLDLRGTRDAHGRELVASVSPYADEMAAASNLARTKSSGEPVVVIRGRAELVTRDDGPGAAPLRREVERDLFV
ncbi:MAG: coenzyme F420-0:L-glutamate ligase [Actinobacteria bacterium]|nr:coenzyme F420-0:L-glutamate ligase [Actinomycetota bacterium]